MYAAISPSDLPPPAPEPATAEARIPRFRGGLLARFAARDGRTYLADLRQTAPCRIAFPRPSAGDPLTAVLVTTSGGLAGGDRLRVDIAAGDGASVLVAGQAAEKVYRSLGPDTRVRTTIAAGAGTWVEWMPQETILFDRARLRRRIELEVAAGARVLAAETVVLGRTASGERFSSGLLHDEWRVKRAGRLVWADALHLSDPVAEPLAQAAGFAGATAMATLMFAAEDAPARLEQARAILDRHGAERVRHGATVVGGLLLVRLLAREAHNLRGVLAAVIAAFRAASAGLPAEAPAMWRI